MSIITLHNEQLTVQVSTMGAELQSIRDAKGVDRLWNGDPVIWSGRAPIMFPVCGGYKDDLYLMDGEPYPMTKHGFAKLNEWKIESVSDIEATFLLDIKTPGFPFNYAFRTTYSLKGNQLSIRFNVKNNDTRVFWYGIGSHEAYATPEGVENYTVCFEKKEDLLVNELVGNLIKPEPYLLKEGVTELDLDPEFFKIDALVFRGLKSRSVTLKSKLHDRIVRVDFDGMDVFMIWQKYKAGYVCLEPWTNAPDTLDTDQQIEHKPGMIRLAPGEEDTRIHTITFA